MDGQPRDSQGRFRPTTRAEADVHLVAPHTDTDLDPELVRVLESAAQLQQQIPDAVLIGGTAAALHAEHRTSYDHDHVLADLTSRYEQVLEACEATDGWATSTRASKPPVTVMGSLGGIEAGIRQLRRTSPLETRHVDLPNGQAVTVPTAHETLRVKAYLVVQRNQVRDYLDVAALSDRLGTDQAAAVLRRIDDYYADRSEDDDAVSTVLVQRLADPDPADRPVIDELASYKRLDARWHDWSGIVATTQEVAYQMLNQER